MLTNSTFGKTVLASLIALLSLPSLKASHVSGADMSYKSLGGGKYTITVRMYRDCGGVPYPGSISYFGVYAGTNGGNSCGTTSLSLTRKAIINASAVCRGGKAACFPANTVGTGPGIEIHVYEATVDFNTTPLSNFVNKSTCCEVTFYAGECCRSSNITTGLANTQFYITCTINICNLNKCSNKEAIGPSYTNAPPTSVCCYDPYYYNPGLVDSVDRDSISYAPVAAFSGLPSTYVTYTSPFTSKYPVTPYCTTSTITCTPQPYLKTPRGFFLDPVNGDIIFTPSQCDEAGVICTEAVEWRLDTTGKYIWIGKVRQEMSVIVKDDCGNNSGADLDSTYNYEVLAGKKLEFKIRVDDPKVSGQTTRDTISLHWNGAIKNATFQVQSDTVPNSETAIFSWQTKPSDGRENLYHFTFTVNDSHCSRPAIGTRAVNIRVMPADTSWFTYNRTACNKISLKGFVGTDHRGTDTFSWTIKDSISNKVLFTATGVTATTGLLPTGKLTITMKVKNKLCHFDDVVRTIAFDSFAPKLTLPKDTSICRKTEYTSASSLSGATAPVKYAWKINGTSKAADTLTTLTVKNLAIDYLLELTVTDKNSCMAVAKQNVKLLPDPAVAWTKTAYAVCRDTGNLLLDRLTNVGDSNNAVFWCQDPSLFLKTGNNNYFQASNIDNNLLGGGTFKEFKIYCSYVSPNGCSSLDSSRIRVNGNPVIELMDKDLCQDQAKFNLDSVVLRPKIKFGQVHLWKVLTAPVGVNKSTLLTNSGGSYFMNIGTKNDTTFDGDYTLQFKVIDQVTSCYRIDTSKIKVINEAVFTHLTKDVCDNITEYSLLLGCRLNNQPISSPANTTFTIKSFNYKTGDPKVSGTTLKNGYLFPTSAGIGRWAFNFKNSDNFCSVSDSFAFNLIMAPNASFTTTPKDSVPISNPVFNTSNSSTWGGSGSLKYYWNFGTGKSTDTSTKMNPVITFPATEGSYNVMLVASSGNGCKDTFYMKLQIGKGSTNVATPEFSNAWINQNFRIYGVDFKSAETRVFDGSGRLVSSFHDNSGAILSSGIYYYQIHFILQNGADAMLKGSIHIQ
jgi:hypothetical protein